MQLVFQLLAVLTLKRSISCEFRSQTFDLPSLLIHTDHAYLLRKLPTALLCHLSPGWSEAKFVSVQWLKDGENVKTLNGFDKDYEINGPVLTIIGGKQQTEGDYQCVAVISEVRLSNRQVITTTLVSDPIKLRRARITKFDQTTNHYVHVEQGQVARLPCAGLPDVVPGPAEICFVKSDSDFDGCLSDKVDSNYLSTATGMQISVVQPHHAGEYYCVVRNDYTKQTRKSPKYVKLRVEPSSNASLSEQPQLPQLVYPSKENRPDNPIVIDAVAGHDVILECVYVRAKVIWTKLGNEATEISLTDDEARLRQVWGNLRIRQVAQDDSGVYSCHGLSPFESADLSLKEYHLQVYYSLVVHAPTDVHLEMNQNARDKSWQLSCLAKNVKYEIPMVYVNGTPLTDAIAEMGVASSANLFSNPVNATIRIRSNYSASVQCVSRPAMDEAEIYGTGLERGRSHNMYVVSSPSKDHLIRQGPVNVTAVVGDDVELICLVIQRVRSKYWLKDGSFVPFGAARTQRVGSNSLKIHNVEKRDEGWYTCVVIGEGSEKSEQQAYLRVSPRFEEVPLQAVSSTESSAVKKKDDIVSIEDVHGFVTDSHVRIQWSVIGKMESLTSVSGFEIEMRNNSSNSSWTTADNVGSHVRATTIRDLVPGNRYQFRVKLMKGDGKVLVSESTSWLFVDHPVEEAPESAFVGNNSDAFENGRNTSETFIAVNNSLNGYLVTYLSKAMMDGFSARSIVILSVPAAVLCLLLLICCTVWCSIRQNNNQSRSPSKSANGKFLDTSYRIFNEQKVHKCRINYANYESTQLRENVPLNTVEE